MRDLFATPSRLVITVVIGLLSLAMIVGTFLVWQYSLNVIRMRSQQQFNNSIDEISFILSSRFNLYTSALYSGKGLFDSSDDVTRLEWHDFINTIDMNKRYPGISSIGYHKIVKNKDKAAFEQRVRKDTSLSKNGYLDFKIYPEGKRDEYFVLTYTEPFTATSTAIMGFDYKTSEIRRDVEEKARESGSATTRKKNEEQPRKVL